MDQAANLKDRAELVPDPAGPLTTGCATPASHVSRPIVTHAEGHSGMFGTVNALIVQAG
jgi:hypothetical protein